MLFKSAPARRRHRAANSAGFESLEDRKVFSATNTVTAVAPELDVQVSRGSESSESIQRETLNETVAQGQISRYDSGDYFTFEAKAGQTYTVRTELGSLRDSKLTLLRWQHWQTTGLQRRCGRQPCLTNRMDGRSGHDSTRSGLVLRPYL